MQNPQTSFIEVAPPELTAINQEVYVIKLTDLFVLSQLYKVTETRIQELIAIVNEYTENNLIDHCLFIFKREQHTVRRGRNLRFAIYCIDTFDLLAAGSLGIAISTYNTVNYEKGITLDARFMLIASSCAFFTAGTLKVFANYFRPKIEEKVDNEAELLSKLINLATKGDLAGNGETKAARKIGCISSESDGVFIPLPDYLMPHDAERRVMESISIIPSTTHPTRYGSLVTTEVDVFIAKNTSTGLRSHLFFK